MKGQEKDQLKTKVYKLLRKHPVFTCISFPLISSQQFSAQWQDGPKQETRNCFC